VVALVVAEDNPVPDSQAVADHRPVIQDLMPEVAVEAKLVTVAEALLHYM
jgi:hypothetical protein